MVIESISELSRISAEYTSPSLILAVPPTETLVLHQQGIEIWIQTTKDVLPRIFSPEALATGTIVSLLTYSVLWWASRIESQNNQNSK